jgi:hypothetical protein
MKFRFELMWRERLKLPAALIGRLNGVGDSSDDPEAMPL